MITSYLINWDEASQEGRMLVLDTIDNASDFQKVKEEAVKNYKVVPFTSADIDLLKKISAMGTKINYQKILTATDKKGNKCLKFEIASPTTEKLLKTHALTVVLICENLIGDRIGYVCSDLNGELHLLDQEDMVKALKDIPGVLNNVFLKNGVQFTQGNYKTKTNKSGEEIAVPIIPSIKVGVDISEQMPEVKTETVSIKNIDKFKAPVKAMIQHGFIEEVKKYRLYNPAFSEDALWSYYALLKNNQGGLIPKLTFPSKNFSMEQYLELAKGIIQGVNYSLYADPSIDAIEMANMRESLKANPERIPTPTRIKKLQIEMAKQGWKDRKAADDINKVLFKINLSKKSNTNKGGK